MAYEYLGNESLDYRPCHYGSSKSLFRGPKRCLKDKYCVVIGGSETFGKYVEQPYPEILEQLTGQKVVNLGCMYAGADFFADRSSLLEICANAQMTVVQLTGAQNMTNRFYSVHSRRNDRFVGASDLLRSIYRTTDFSDIHYTGHLLEILRKTSANRFEIVRKELQSEWVSRMCELLSMIGGKVVLLWLADRAPEDANQTEPSDPMFLDRDMIDQLAEQVTGVVEVVVTPDEISAGHDRMIFTQMEAAAARQMLGPIAHQAAARKLQPYLDAI